MLREPDPVPTEHGTGYGEEGEEHSPSVLGSPLMFDFSSTVVLILSSYKNPLLFSVSIGNILSVLNWRTL